MVEKNYAVGDAVVVGGRLGVVSQVLSDDLEVMVQVRLGAKTVYAAEGDLARPEERGE